MERLTRAGTKTSDTRLDLSPGTKKLLEMAADESRRMGHHYIGTEHLLLALVGQPDGVAIEVLKRNSVSPEEVRRQTRRVLQEAPVSSTPPQPAAAETTASVMFRNWLAVMKTAGIEAEALGQHVIGTEHVLIALVVAEDSVGQALRVVGC